MTHLNPQFHLVKTKFTRIYTIFLIFAHNIECGSLDPLKQESKSMLLTCFEQNYEKYHTFQVKIVIFKAIKITLDILTSFENLTFNH